MSVFLEYSVGADAVSQCSLVDSMLSEVSFMRTLQVDVSMEDNMETEI